MTNEAAASQRPRLDQVGGALESVRMHIEAAVKSCTIRPSWCGSAEPAPRWLSVPLRPVEVAVLRRLGHRLDQLAARYRSSAGLAQVRGVGDPLAKFERALTAHAEAMAERFECKQVHHDLIADLESDLWIIEQLLDERASSCQSLATRKTNDATRPDGKHATPMRRHPPATISIRPGDSASQPSSRADYGAALRTVDRLIAEAKDDFPLRKFWECARLNVQREANRPSTGDEGAPMAP